MHLCRCEQSTHLVHRDPARQRARKCNRPLASLPLSYRESSMARCAGTQPLPLSERTSFSDGRRSNTPEKIIWAKARSL